MVPDNDGAVLESPQKGLLSLFISLFSEQLREVQIIPAYDGVADQSVAPLRHLLLHLLRVQELLVATETDGDIPAAMRALEIVGPYDVASGFLHA